MVISIADLSFTHLQSKGQNQFHWWYLSLLRYSAPLMATCSQDIFYTIMFTVVNGSMTLAL